MTDQSNSQDRPSSRDGKHARANGRSKPMTAPGPSGAESGRRGLDEAPLMALAGGIAVGAVLAALIPAAARSAKCSARSRDRDQGQGQIAPSAPPRTPARPVSTSSGLTRDKGTETLRSMFEGAGNAAKASAEAAVGTVRKD